MVWEEIVPLLEILLFPGFLFLIALALFYEWVDRKFFARLQNRYGPLYTGPSGILQPLADFVKLLSKEDIIPKAADTLMFNSAPIFLLALPLLALFLIPIADLTAVISFEGDYDRRDLKTVFAQRGWYRAYRWRSLDRASRAKVRLLPADITSETLR